MNGKAEFEIKIVKNPGNPRGCGLDGQVGPLVVVTWMLTLGRPCATEMRLGTKLYFRIIDRAAARSLNRKEYSKMKVVTLLVQTHKQVYSKRCLFYVL